MLALRKRVAKQPKRPTRLRASNRDGDPSASAAKSIGRSPNQEAFQQLDQRLVLTRSDDADFKLN